jgi:pyruvate dehydrogenase E1 component alpha subunit
LSTFRWREHCGPNFDNELNYRSVEDVAAGIATCPITFARKRIVDAGLATADQLEQLEIDINREITAAFEFAMASPAPTYTDATGKVYAQ